MVFKVPSKSCQPNLSEKCLVRRFQSWDPTLHEFGLASLRVSSKTNPPPPHLRNARQFAHRSFACTTLFPALALDSTFFPQAGLAGSLHLALILYTSTPYSCQIRQDSNVLTTNISKWPTWA